jgi:protein O-GlcNAc transferase
MSTWTIDPAQERFEKAYALHRQGRNEEALAMYDAALAANPRHAPALHYSAVLLHQQERFAEAIGRIEASIASDASVPDVWTNAGLIYGRVGRHVDAIRAIERAIALEPTLGEAWLNLSHQRLEMDDPVAAEAAARQALSLSLAQPSTAWFNLALALTAQGRREQALKTLDQMESLRSGEPLNVAVHGLRTQLLIATGQHEAARKVLDHALAEVDDPVLLLERARLAETQGDLATATADYAASLRSMFGTDASQEMALSELIFLKKRLALWDDLPQLQSVFRQRVAWHDKTATVSMLTPFSYLSDQSSRVEQRACAEAYSRRYRSALLQPRYLSKGRLKIGYLSADLHQHATGILAVGLFEQHDRQRFEVFAYSTGPDDRSPLRERIVAAFDQFVDARGWSEPQVARRIADDGIDILVDLKGHTERAPTLTMAMRPAPIAVSYLGYPGTMGASFIDYVIGDRIVTPLAHAKDYSETIVQLPHSYQINDDRRVIALSPTRAELGLPDDAVVLCGFNSTYKINAEVLDTWVEILGKVQGAVLWLLTSANDQPVRDRLLHEAIARGADARRIVFADTRPHGDYLALYRCADLFLDTWPYNAHTTASDALWAGCPIVTMSGETFANRVAASLLNAVGINTGVAMDRANYVGTAVAAANNRPRLAAMRKQLEETVRAAPLFDTRSTTRAIEAAYLAMATQFNEGRRAPILVSSDFTVSD